MEYDLKHLIAYYRISSGAKDSRDIEMTVLDVKGFLSECIDLLWSQKTNERKRYPSKRGIRSMASKFQRKRPWDYNGAQRETLKGFIHIKLNLTVRSFFQRVQGKS